MKLNIQAQMEYPAFLISWFCSNMLQFFTGIAAIKFVINHFYNINGWGFDEIVFMYGLGVISHALSVILFIQTRYLQYFITEGEFDRMLLRPLGVMAQYIASVINLIGLTDMLPGIIIFIYGAIKLNFDFTFLNIIKVLCVIIGATVLRGGLYTLCGSISFWTKRGDLAELLSSIITNVNTYPVSIYGKTIQWVFTFIIPIAFICFYPAAEFMNKDTGYVFAFSPSVMSLVIGFGVFALSTVVFKIGLTMYESAGS